MDSIWTATNTTQANNFTSTLISKGSTTMSPDSWSHLYTYIIYATEGSVMLVGNLSVAFAIWRYEALRTNKGYFVFAFMFFCDALNGLAQLCAAIYRTALLVLGTHDVLVSRWECMRKLHTIVWAFSEPCAAMMLAVISLDRILLVRSPGQYFSSHKLTYTSISVPFIWSAIGVLVATWMSYNSPRYPPTVAQYCLLSFGLGKDYWAYHGFLSVFGATLSIVLYGMVLRMNRRRINATTNGGKATEAMLEGQQKLTRSLGLSCLVTTFVFLIPRLIGTTLDYAPWLDRSTVSFLMMVFYWIIGNFNSVINLVIFLRIDTIRAGVRALWMGKAMPVKLAMWSSTASQTKQQTIVNVTSAPKPITLPTG